MSLEARPTLRRIGSQLIRLDGTRARMERSFQRHMRVYAEELTRADLSDPDSFIALIQCASDLRLPAGRLAEICEVSTQTVRGWIRGRDLPSREAQAEVILRIRTVVEERIRIAPDLSLPGQAARGSPASSS